MGVDLCLASHWAHMTASCRMMAVAECNVACHTAVDVEEGVRGTWKVAGCEIYDFDMLCL
jgi:hypothetical protein